MRVETQSFPRAAGALRSASLLLSVIVQEAGQAEWADLGGRVNGEDSLVRHVDSVELSGDGKVLAASTSISDRIRVYLYEFGDWRILGNPIEGNAWEFGESIALSEDGSVVAFSAHSFDGNISFDYHAKVYRYSFGSWSQVGEDIGIESPSFGPSVALSSDGMTLVVGSDSVSGESGLLAGQVSVYRLVSGNWAKVGDDIPGGFVQENSGHSVDISSDGEIVAVGAPSNSEQGTRSGVVRVFRYSSAGWNQVGADLRGGSKDGVFGRSVSLSSDGYTVAIGAPGQGTSVDGKAKVYEFKGGGWLQKGQELIGSRTGDGLGVSISLSDDSQRLAVTTRGVSGDAGYTKMYNFIEGSWVRDGPVFASQQGNQVSDSSMAMDGLGKNLAIGGMEGSSGYAEIKRNYSIDDTFGPAPNSIKGIALDFRIENGDGVLLADSGRWLFAPSATNSSYSIIPVSANVGMDEGTYSYLKSSTFGGRAFATSTLESVLGVYTSSFAFSSQGDGRYSASSSLFPQASQSGSFKTLIGESATSLVGKTMSVEILYASGPAFASYGGFEVWFGADNETFILKRLYGDLLEGFGSFSYSKDGQHSGSGSLTSVGGLDSTFEVFFEDRATGFLVVRNASSESYQVGRFAIDDPVVDTDGDGLVDTVDAFPLNLNEWTDTDADGIGDNQDQFPNDASEVADRDSDGIGDNADAFPENPYETKDSDRDGIGDNSDVFPFDRNEWADADSDGVGDNSDDFPFDASEAKDSDGDGIGDNADVFPLDPAESADSDLDGVGDNSDAFPIDPSESTDSDLDGIGDNADAFPTDPNETKDTDSDGVGDNADAFPEDPSESLDTDGDGIGNNADAFPEDPSESLDNDLDGIGDNYDPDDDNDGEADSSDAFPFDSSEKLDTDSDGIGNNRDTDDDGDGYLDRFEISFGFDPLVADDASENESFVLSMKLPFLENLDMGEGLLTQGDLEIAKQRSRSIINVSARVHLKAGESVIPGFVVLGESKRLLIRAVGPKLADLGVQEPIPNPIMSVYKTRYDGLPSDLVITIDDWAESSELALEIEAVTEAVGGFPLGPSDEFQGSSLPTNDLKSASTIIKLDTGVYTVVVESADNGVGEVLVEVYEVIE